jgi:hypothetical protein
MNVSNGTGKPSPHPIVLMTSSLLKTDEQNQKNIHIYRVPCDVQYMKEKKKKRLELLYSYANSLGRKVRKTKLDFPSKYKPYLITQVSKNKSSKI